MKLLTFSVVVAVAGFVILYRQLEEPEIHSSVEVRRALAVVSDELEPLPAASVLPVPAIRIRPTTVPAAVEGAIREQLVSPLRERQFVLVFDTAAPFSRAMRTTRIEVPFDITYDLAPVEGGGAASLYAGTLFLTTPADGGVSFEVRVGMEQVVQVRIDDEWVDAADWLDKFSIRQILAEASAA